MQSPGSGTEGQEPVDLPHGAGDGGRKRRTHPPGKGRPPVPWQRQTGDMQGVRAEADIQVWGAGGRHGHQGLRGPRVGGLRVTPTGRLLGFGASSSPGCSWPGSAEPPWRSYINRISPAQSLMCL